MYFVKLNSGAEIAVQIAETRRGQWRATTADGTVVDLEIKGRGADGTFVIVVDGVQRSFRMDAESGEVVLIEGDASHEVEVVHAADLVLQSAAAANPDISSSATLASPITGIVLQLPTKSGDVVSKGDVVVVVEAMKMENSLGAPRSGTVVEIFTEPGQTVFVGDPLVRIQ